MACSENVVDRKTGKTRKCRKKCANGEVCSVHRKTKRAVEIIVIQAGNGDRRYFECAMNNPDLASYMDSGSRWSKLTRPQKKMIARRLQDPDTIEIDHGEATMLIKVTKKDFPSVFLFNYA